MAEDCVAFLQWGLPRLGLRWQGFRRVRRTVCKRLRRRLGELGLADLAAYRRRLEADLGEWQSFDALCRIPISRFYRDRGVFDALAAQVLPALAAAAGPRPVACWSAGCAGGEEPYTLALLGWFALRPQAPAARLSILATDIDPAMIARARRACYGPASLRELPAAWRHQAFRAVGDELCLAAPWRDRVTFAVQDLRRQLPDGPFDLILCRNLAFTYFAPAEQATAAARLLSRLRPGGCLVVGAHEDTAAARLTGLERACGALPIFRARPAGS